jgi:DNA invertase Pin-like site-specific DNA recombinase
MKIGYARVSTDEQNSSLQLQALQAAGCASIVEDHGLSGAQTARPGLDQVLNRLQAGDVLVVWRLDRLSRSLVHLIELIDRIGRSRAGFMSLTEAIDTTTAGGRLVFHIMGALAEFERGLISERTRAGMKAAQRRGKHIGRPRKLTVAQVEHARDLIASRKASRGEVAELFAVDVKTLRRALGPEGTTIRHT